MELSMCMSCGTTGELDAFFDSYSDSRFWYTCPLCGGEYIYEWEKALTDLELVEDRANVAEKAGQIYTPYIPLRKIR